jgi:hypothetical protein
MSWKGLFALLLVLLILGVLVSGEEIGLLDRLRGVMDWLLGRLRREEIKEALTIPLRIEVKKEAAYGQRFGLEGSSIELAGLCADELSLDDITLGLANRACKLKSEVASGHLGFNPLGVLEASLTSSHFLINELSYAGEVMSVEAKLAPTFIRATNISKDVIFLVNAYGEARVFKRTGEPELLKYLDGEDLEVRGFEGEILLQNLTFVLQGEASEVRGLEPRVD